MEKNVFTVNGKTATLYKAVSEDRPLIVFNQFEGDGSDVVEVMKTIDTPECNLLVVSDLQWDHEMSPWYCPPTFSKGTPYTGGADDYLNILLHEILPWAKSQVKGIPSFVGITGYSLAGLFALYALYRCDAFDAAASMSGSLWFPDFADYVQTHGFLKRPLKLYLSLGDREARTRNVYMKDVQVKTEEILQHYREIGLNVLYEMNPGNHFKDTELRSAKGIKALLI